MNQRRIAASIPSGGWLPGLAFQAAICTAIAAGLNASECATSASNRTANTRDTATNAATGGHVEVGKRTQLLGVQGVGDSARSNALSARDPPTSAGQHFLGEFRHSNLSDEACGCAVSEACILIDAALQNSDQMPWLKWPDGEADGRGTLIVSAWHGLAIRIRRAFGRIDFVAQRRYAGLILGCVVPEALAVHFFLDDNENASAMATTSAESADCCGGSMAPATVSIAPRAGQVTTVRILLGPPCDPNRD